MQKIHINDNLADVMTKSINVEKFYLVYILLWRSSTISNLKLEGVEMIKQYKKK